MTDAERKAKAKYDKKNTRQIMLKFNINTDGDILDRLSEVDNKQGYIKKLIRQDIRRS